MASRDPFDAAAVASHALSVANGVTKQIQHEQIPGHEVPAALALAVHAPIEVEAQDPGGAEA